MTTSYSLIVLAVTLFLCALPIVMVVMALISVIKTWRKK